MHAFEDIAGLYREELRSLREDAVRFAVRNPGMARQLGLASDTQPDPLVNLLLESFAWLAARVRADAESRLPLVSHSLLGLLYPQFVCPIPSVGVAEFIPNPAGVAGLPDGFGIPAHTPIHNRDERGGVLRWRTARPLTLHPAKVVRASIIPPASWMPAAAQGVPGVLCLRIEGIAGLSLAKFGLPSLSLHLGGDRFATFPMHEWVHGACKDVFLADDAGAAKPRALSLGREALCHAGLEPGGRLFPESAYALPGYQLLQEYFAYPEHLLFWEVGGLERRRELGDLPGFDLLFPVDAPPPKTVSSRLFRTCAVPVVNLFESSTNLKHWFPVTACSRCIWSKSLYKPFLSAILKFFRAGNMNVTRFFLFCGKTRRNGSEEKKYSLSGERYQLDVLQPTYFAGSHPPACTLAGAYGFSGYLFQ